MSDLAIAIFYTADDLITENYGVFTGVLLHGAAYRFDGYIANAKSPGNRTGTVTISGYSAGTAPAQFSYSIINDIIQNL